MVARVSIGDHFSGGNLDGMASPGELLSLLIELENGSGEEMYGVRGSLRGETARSSIVRGEVSYGDIGPGETEEGRYEIQVSPQAPTDTSLEFWLVLSDSSGTSDTVSIPVYLVARFDSLFLSSKYLPSGEAVRLRAYFYDGEGRGEGGGIDEVLVELRNRDGELVGEEVLYDDGGHRDGLAEDGEFSNIWWTLAQPMDYRVSLKIFANMDRYEGLKEDLLGFTTKEFSPDGDVLLVNDELSAIPSEDVVGYYEDCLQELGVDYSYWYSWYRGDIDTNSISQFLPHGVVLWCAPQGGRIRSSPQIREVVEHYLDRGGRLLLASGGLGRHLSAFGTSGDSLFLTDYLHARWVTGFNPEDHRDLVRGVDEDPISDGLFLSIIGEDGISQYYTDEIDPIPPAVPIFTFDRPGRSSSTAGLRMDNGGYRVVYFAFGLEGIGSLSERKRLIERSLRWLRYGDEAEEEDESEEIGLLLFQNTPNPFSSQTEIFYKLPLSGRVFLHVCDLTGSVVRVLEEEDKTSGLHSLVWDGKDGLDREVANGYYFYRLNVEFDDLLTESRWVVTKKMLLLK